MRLYFVRTESYPHLFPAGQLCEAVDLSLMSVIALRSRIDPTMVFGFHDDEIELFVPHLAKQTKKVLSILRLKGSLTGVEAQAIAKVRSLTKRIHELRTAGFGIHSETRRDTEGQRYVRYYLANDLPTVTV